MDSLVEYMLYVLVYYILIKNQYRYVHSIT
jgi:hypothetical protein